MKSSVMYEKLRSGSKVLTLALMLLMLASFGYAETWDIHKGVIAVQAADRDLLFGTLQSSILKIVIATAVYL